MNIQVNLKHTSEFGSLTMLVYCLGMYIQSALRFIYDRSVLCYISLSCVVYKSLVDIYL